jgi:hypothetical protein
VLLDAIASLAESGRNTAEYEFGWRHATGWLSALKRLSPPSTRSEAVLIFDASVPCDVDSLHAQALELVLRRTGVRSLTLTPGIELGRLGRALRALEPSAVVLTGRRVSLDALGRLVYAVRRVAGEVAVFDYRGAVPDTGASTVTRLGETPVKAVELLLNGLERRPAPMVQPAPAPMQAARG